MLANMAISLIMHKRITTTVAKAKALKKYVEPLITKAKEDSTNSRRVVFSYLQNKEAIKELFSAVSEKVGDRPGGYTRIIKLGTRQGDAAQVCFIELRRRRLRLLLKRLLLPLRRQRKRLRLSNNPIGLFRVIRLLRPSIREARIYTMRAFFTFSPFYFFTFIGFFLFVFRENPFSVCRIMLTFAPLNIKIWTI